MIVFAIPFSELMNAGREGFGAMMLLRLLIRAGIGLLAELVVGILVSVGLWILAPRLARRIIVNEAETGPALAIPEFQSLLQLILVTLGVLRLESLMRDFTLLLTRFTLSPLLQLTVDGLIVFILIFYSRRVSKFITRMAR